MAWLVALIIVGFLWNRVEDERCLREMHRLLRHLDIEELKPPPTSPSPHQLLGEIARPFAPIPHGRRSIEITFRCRRNG